jgi:DNA-binding LacI/PurR family transcriptional regulator
VREPSPAAGNLLGPSSSGHLYQRLKEHIGRQIASGALRKDDLLPSEAELCRTYGMSAITVRRALRELVRDGVIRRQPGRGTIVISETRRLRIALVFAGFREDHWRRASAAFGGMFGGIGEATWLASVNLVTHRVPPERDLAERLIELMRDPEYAMDGLLIRCADDIAEGPLSTLEAHRMPYVVIKRSGGDRPMNYVTGDDRGAARTATRHLLSLGYERVAYLGEPPVITTHRDILSGYRDALEEAGRPFDEGLTLFMSSPNDGDLDVHDEEEPYLLTRQLLQSRERPRAIFMGSTIVTSGVYRAIAEARLAIPDDIALVGYGATEVVRHLRPTLTMMSMSHYDLGKVAVEHLLEQIADPNMPPRGVHLDVPLVIGESCGARKSDPLTTPTTAHS